MAPSLWIAKDIRTKAVGLLQSGSTRDAVELILKNDLSFGATEPITPTPEMFDAGDMLAKALAVLGQAPHTALGVPLGAEIPEIRKAYKKCALKYHPDKNPRTTVLFQLIQTACDKLCDPALKAEAERAAAQSTAPPRSGQQPAPPPHPKSGGPKRPGAPQTTSSTQHQRPEPSYRPKPASSSTNTSQDTHAKPNNASSVPPGGASTSNYPNYRAAGAPAGPYNFQAPGNNPDQDRKYAEFAKMRAEADANRRKAAQAARDAERYARMEAVRKSQETAARAKERQREEDEKYGSHQNREAANRRYREYVQEESNQYQKSSNAYERAHYEYEKDYTKKEKKEESKLPQAYQDDLEKVLRSHRNESSTKGGSSVPKTMPKSEPDSYRNYREQLRKRGGRSEKEKSEKTDAEVKSDKASKAEKSDKSEKMKYKKDGKEGSRDFESQIPIPSYTYKATNLRKTAMTADSIDLEWTMPVLPASQADVTVLSELSWRKVDLTAAHFPPWESSGKLITGCKCRKKNLVKGIQYDFRVRTAIPTSATYNTHTSSAPNMFTKSEWSDIYSVTTPAGEPTKVQQTQGVPSGSRPNKTQQEVKPKESANPTGNGTGGAKIRIHPIDRRPVDIKVEKARDPQPAVDIKTKLGGSGRMAWSADPEDYLNDFNNTAAEQEDADDDEAGSVNAEWYQLTMPSSASSTEKLHEVRIEPFPASPVIGWISTNKFVEVQAVCGDWGKVRYHKVSDQKKKAVSSNGRMGWGWSLLIDHQSNHKYLEKCDKSDVESTKMRNEDANTKQSGNRKGTTIEGGVAGFSDVEVDGEVSDDDGNDDDDDMFDELFLNHKFRETQQAHKKASSGVFARNASGGVSGDGIPVTPKRSFRDAETGDDVWFEEFDEHLNPYYVNQRTGESKWEPPEWVAEIDEASGCTYYVKLNTTTAQPLHSTWSKPNFFSKIIRGVPAYHADDTPIQEVPDLSESGELNFETPPPVEADSIVDEEEAYYKSEAFTVPDISNKSNKCADSNPAGSAKHNNSSKYNTKLPKIEKVKEQKRDKTEKHYNYFDLEEDIMDASSDLNSMDTHQNTNYTGLFSHDIKGYNKNRHNMKIEEDKKIKKVSDEIEEDIEEDLH